MKTMHGAFRFACSNKSRTQAAPAPANISTNSEPEIEKWGTFACPAKDLASSISPARGGSTQGTRFLGATLAYLVPVEVVKRAIFRAHLADL
jgi:hypothetical protein